MKNRTILFHRENYKCNELTKKKQEIHKKKKKENIICKQFQLTPQDRQLIHGVLMALNLDLCSSNSKRTMEIL